MVVLEPKSKNADSPHEVTESLSKALQHYTRWMRIQSYTPVTLKHKNKELGVFLRWLETEGHSLLAGELTSLDILGHL